MLRIAIVLQLGIVLFMLNGVGCDRPAPPADGGASPSASAEQRVAQDEPSAAPAADVPPQALERARTVTREFSRELMGRLMSELGQGGPKQALVVCAEVAQQMADRKDEADLSIRRVSLKVRNPADEPDAYERDKLGEFAQLHASDALPPEHYEVVRQDGDRQLRYMRPIMIMGLCLNCHGPADTLSTEVRAVLEEKYPGDEATGYAVGDLRGAFSVVIDLPEDPEQP